MKDTNKTTITNETVTEKTNAPETTTEVKNAPAPEPTGKDISNIRKSLKYMPKRDMKTLCEEMKKIGIKYKVAGNEKNIFNLVLTIIQSDWEVMNNQTENLIQL